MEVFAGKGKVSLSQKDFIAKGGQGSIYGRGGIAYKIFEDQTQMIPVAKIQELSKLSDPRIIKPEIVVYDASNHPIGYTMRQLEEAHALVKLFPKAFRDRNKITPDAIVKLVKQIQDTMVDHIHPHGILIVDLNQKNFLVNSAFNEVYFIDVDSYQTPNFKCPVQMPNVHDYHTHGFNKESDYFAFGIVSFNLFIGVHPFMGNHPGYGWPMNEEILKLRMQKNASIFDNGVQLPGVCQPFSVIPQAYLDWYKSLFVNGKRLPPPTELQPVIVIVTPKVSRMKGTDNFDIGEFLTLPEEIVLYENLGGTGVTITKRNVYSGKRQLSPYNGGDVSITPKLRHVIVASMENGYLKLFNASANAAIPGAIRAQQIMSYDGRVYVKDGGSLFEIDYIELAASVVPTLKLAATVHQKSTKLFDGVATQSLMGNLYVTVFPKLGEAMEVNIKEVEGEVVDAKYENNVLMLIAVKGSKYSRYVVRFNREDKSYDVKVVHDIAYTGFNFVVLENGICCNMTEAEEIELFRNVKGDTMVKVVPDQHVDSDMRLFKNGTQVLFAKGESLYTLKMK